jgi:2'-5' RNA ligase
MDEVEELADHWWWRPGWSEGRRFYTWHLTFSDAPEVHRLADTYRAALAPVAGLDLVPDKWLHLTMQGVGFVDELAAGDVDAIVQGARERLAYIESFSLEFGCPQITDEAIRWDLDGGGPSRVRDAIRAAIGDVWADIPEDAADFGAHVSIAYSHANGPAEPVRAALEAVRAPAAHARIAHADLIRLGRDHRMYEWTTYASVGLSGA